MEWSLANTFKDLVTVTNVPRGRFPGYLEKTSRCLDISVVSVISATANTPQSDTVTRFWTVVRDLRQILIFHITLTLFTSCILIELSCPLETTNGPLIYTNTVSYRCYMFRRHAILREFHTKILNLIKYNGLKSWFISQYSIVAAK